MLPRVRPVIIAVTLLLVIWGLNSITIIYAITRGGPANRTLITPIQISASPSRRRLQPGGGALA